MACAFGRLTWTMRSSSFGFAILTMRVARLAIQLPTLPARKFGWNITFNEKVTIILLSERLDATPLGTFGIYDIAGGSGECGRFIIRPGVRASIPSTILAGDLAFEKIGLEQLRATAVVGNRAIRSFMAKLGFCEVGVKPGGRNIGGQAVDMVHLVVTPQRWAGCREHVIALATRAEKQIERWREAQAWAENWRENHLQSVK